MGKADVHLDVINRKDVLEPVPNISMLLESVMGCGGDKCGCLYSI